MGKYIVEVESINQNGESVFGALMPDYFDTQKEAKEQYQILKNAYADKSWVAVQWGLVGEEPKQRYVFKDSDKR